MQTLPPILQTTYIDTHIEKVFETLTTAQGWDAWFTKGCELDLDTKKIRFVWKNWGPDRINTEAPAIIQSYIPHTEFSFTWGRYNTLVKLSLSLQGSGTRIHVNESGYKNDEEAATQMLDCACGWAEALTLLKLYLEYGVVYKEAPSLS